MRERENTKKSAESCSDKKWFSFKCLYWLSVLRRARSEIRFLGTLFRARNTRSTVILRVCNIFIFANSFFYTPGRRNKKLRKIILRDQLYFCCCWCVECVVKLLQRVRSTGWKKIIFALSEDHHSSVAYCEEHFFLVILVRKLVIKFTQWKTFFLWMEEFNEKNLISELVWN